MERTCVNIRGWTKILNIKHLDGQYVSLVLKYDVYRGFQSIAGILNVGGTAMRINDVFFWEDDVIGCIVGENQDMRAL